MAFVLCFLFIQSNCSISVGLGLLKGWPRTKLENLSDGRDLIHLEFGFRQRGVWLQLACL